MNERKRIARHEASLTGNGWESDRARKRRLTNERRERLANTLGTIETAASRSADPFGTSEWIKRDNRARGITGRVYRANGDGDRPTQKEREHPVISYDERARSLLGY